ncbi:DMT family transporter [Cellulosimicrobium cellulans]|uniref:DMT family transporter n=1 Tax=Cellulosimicrobium cellulans TaxID=1710 RepID=UPI0036EE6017
MNRWVVLAIAIVAEVAATLAMRAAVDNLWWAVLTVVGYAGAFVALAAILRTGMPIGVVYGIWSAAGVSITAILGSLLFAEPFTLLIAVGIAVIVAGVILVETGSHAKDTAAAAEVTR